MKAYDEGSHWTYMQELAIYLDGTFNTLEAPW